MKALNKKQTVKEIMTLLDNGKTVYIEDGCLWEGNCRLTGRRLIYWRHYGQSANRRNLRDLTWIINTIFERKGKVIEYSYK
jgi:hypothetical protein